VLDIWLRLRESDSVHRGQTDWMLCNCMLRAVRKTYPDRLHFLFLARYREFRSSWNLLADLPCAIARRASGIINKSEMISQSKSANLGAHLESNRWLLLLLLCIMCSELRSESAAAYELLKFCFGFGLHDLFATQF
jgi:hypothetical protein